MNEPMMPVLFLSHGGGPWPWMEDMREHYHKTYSALREFGEKHRPRGIIMVSGHWEETEFTVSTATHPDMIYDYSGFPPHTYKIQYPAPGDPALARRLREVLENNGLTCREDSNRGLDHGCFVPLYCLYPDADIPIVTLSIKRNYSVHEHLRLGELLSSFRSEGLLIIGSGLSYHNMREMYSPAATPVSERFGQWLSETLSMSSVERKGRLLVWEKAPDARRSHPREDHLVPLFVAIGVAGEDRGLILVDEKVFGVEMISYIFES